MAYGPEGYGTYDPPDAPPYGGYGAYGTPVAYGTPMAYEPPPRPVWQLLVVPLLVGSMVAVGLGAYASLHEPTGIAISLAGFSGPMHAKAWLASGALVFAVVQLLSSMVMYDKMPGVAPPVWIGGLHRWSGRIAFLLAIPVAIHCLYAVGFQVGTPRALAHSLLGCLFFGAFVVKMLGLRKDGLAGWVLPVLGGFVFTGLVGLWLTSSLWFFSTFGVVR